VGLDADLRDHHAVALGEPADLDLEALHCPPVELAANLQPV
jgi:hypothetical protein